MQWQDIGLVMLVAMMLSGGVSAAESLDVWVVDPLEKVFRDATPVEGAAAVAHAARGETVDFQIVVRSSTASDSLRVDVSPFTHESGAPSLPVAAARFVGYVHVDRPTQRPSADQLRKPPCDYPDILLEDSYVSLAANTPQPVWISLTAPVDAPPGAYVATAAVTANDGQPHIVPLKAQVYPVTVKKTRLWVTNWFSMQWRHMEISPEPESKAYYCLLYTSPSPRDRTRSRMPSSA